ncbi:hypothetical protein KIPB_013695, partial [Kipferlia bialata]|eukprot:g13695.t1
MPSERERDVTLREIASSLNTLMDMMGGVTARLTSVENRLDVIESHHTEPVFQAPYNPLIDSLTSP